MGRLPDPAARSRRILRAAIRRGLSRLSGCDGATRIGIGLSGGLDSTVLTRLLAEANPRPQLVALHLDHALRPDATEQARFAGTVASGIGIPFVQEREDVAARARRTGRPVEEAGRRARLDFFGRAAAERRLAAVAVAHTRSDQAETLVLQLARGAGGLGLAAMPEIRTDSRGFRLWRPLLEASRSDLTEIAAAEGWDFFPDPSNRDPRFTRNRVRERVLPQLAEELNPQIERALARTATLLRDDEEWLQDTAKTHFRELADDTRPGEVRLPVPAVARLPPALARRVLRETLQAVRGHLRRIGLVHIEAVRRLLRQPQRGASLDLPGVLVRIEDRSLVVEGRAPEDGGARYNRA